MKKGPITGGPFLCIFYCFTIHSYRHDFTLHFCEYLTLFTGIYLLKYGIKSTSDSIYNSLIQQSFLTTISPFPNT